MKHDRPLEERIAYSTPVVPNLWAAALYWATEVLQVGRGKIKTMKDY